MWIHIMNKYPYHQAEYLEKRFIVVTVNGLLSSLHRASTDLTNEFSVLHIIIISLKIML